MRQLPQKIEDSRAISATLDTGVAALSGTGVGVCIARQGGTGYWKHIHCLRYNRMFTVPVLTTELLSPLGWDSSHRLHCCRGSSKREANRIESSISKLLFLNGPVV